MASTRAGRVIGLVIALPLSVVGIVLAGCNPAIGAPSGGPTPGPTGAFTGVPSGGLTFGVHGRATAGPTCPVEPASPLPGACAPRAVAGAVLVITDGQGHEVARPITASDGTFSVDLPSGMYTLTPQRVVGLFGVAQPIDFTVSAGGGSDLLVPYDTGIR
jgi:hypothetical protein